MEFRVLGPVEVLDDDGVVASLGGPRPRALLACLLLHANEVVSTDRLIDAIWGEEPLLEAKARAGLELPLDDTVALALDRLRAAVESRRG